MKITKIMKSLYLPFLTLFLAFSIPCLSFAQEADKEKEVKIKVVKEENGKKTVYDTSFVVSGDSDIHDIEELKEILENEGIEDFDFDFNFDDDGEVNVNVVKIEGDEGGNEKIMVVKKKKGDETELEKDYMITVMKSGESSEGSTMHMSIDGGESIFITEDGDIHEIEMGDGSEKMIIVKQKDGENVEMMFGDEDNVWVGDDHSLIEVIEGEDGKKVIVKNEDGTTREYLIEEGEGSYFIGEDGEMKKVDSDVDWVEEDEDGMRKVTVHVDDDNEAIVIMENGKTIELKDFDKGNNAFFYSTDDGSGENEVFVEIIEKSEGGETIIVKSKIVVKSISDEDIEALEKSGVKLKGDDMEKLEVENLVFHPNPSDGKFRLEFTAPEKATTEIMIYDMQGNMVYDERITSFKGKYNKEIDISSESKGTYFLKISQGNKMSSRKIILD